ncbi:hypothetical protein SLA2020_413910 [Shorea laevis]
METSGLTHQMTSQTRTCISHTSSDLTHLTSSVHQSFTNPSPVLPDTLNFIHTPSLPSGALKTLQASSVLEVSNPVAHLIPAPSVVQPITTSTETLPLPVVPMPFSNLPVLPLPLIDRS